MLGTDKHMRRVSMGFINTSVLLPPNHRQYPLVCFRAGGASRCTERTYQHVSSLLWNPVWESSFMDFGASVKHLQSGACTFGCRVPGSTG